MIALFRLGFMDTGWYFLPLDKMDIIQAALKERIKLLKCKEDFYKNHKGEGYSPKSPAMDALDKLLDNSKRNDSLEMVQCDVKYVAWYDSEV